jgi:DNA-binding Lrp family transcriptional regulator
VDDADRAIVNALQGGFPICERPYALTAAGLGMSEAELIDRLQVLLGQGLLSRFGPMYHAERLGGALCLCAMEVPAARFEEVAEIVNAFPEVAHNYARDHRLDMWFVVATERAEAVGEVVGAIERRTGLKVHAMPKIEEFFVGLRLEA